MKFSFDLFGIVESSFIEAFLTKF